jgi:hypothetical protein
LPELIHEGKEPRPQSFFAGWIIFTHGPDVVDFKNLVNSGFRKENAQLDSLLRGQCAPVAHVSPRQTSHTDEVAVQGASLRRRDSSEENLQCSGRPGRYSNTPPVAVVTTSVITLYVSIDPGDVGGGIVNLEFDGIVGIEIPVARRGSQSDSRRFLQV